MSTQCCIVVRFCTMGTNTFLKPCNMSFQDFTSLGRTLMTFLSKKSTVSVFNPLQCLNSFILLFQVSQNSDYLNLKYEFRVRMKIFHRAIAGYTGCKRRIQKKFELKIWKKSMLVLKQKLHQQKAHDVSFHLTP